MSSSPSAPFLTLFSAAARQLTAFSHGTHLETLFLRAYYVRGTVPGTGEAAELQADCSSPPRVSCLEGETDAGQMITQMFSCPCDGWGQLGAAEEKKAK